MSWLRFSGRRCPAVAAARSHKKSPATSVSRLDWLRAGAQSKKPQGLTDDIAKVAFLKILGADRLTLDLLLAGLRHYARPMLYRKPAALAHVRASRRTLELACFLRLQLLRLTDSGLDLLALCAHYGMQPIRNNRGIAHENGGIESPHGHLKKAVSDALLMRGTGDFDGLASYRRFSDEIVSRKNTDHARRIEAERPAPQLLPGQRTCDHEETLVTVTS